MKKEVNPGVLKEADNIVTVADFIRSVEENQEIPMVWIEWECTERSLERRAQWLTDKFMQIAKSKRIDAERLAVGFINSQHGADTQAYLDEIVLFDPSNNNIEFDVVPYRKSKEEDDRGFVYQASTGFKKPVFRGRWPDIRKWFMTFSPDNPEGIVKEKQVIKGPRDLMKVKLPRTVRVRRQEMDKTAA